MPEKQSIGTQDSSMPTSPKKQGDVIVADIGADAKNVSVGKNIIHIGSLNIPVWMLGVIALILISVIAVTLYTDFTPQRLKSPDVKVSAPTAVDLRPFGGAGEDTTVAVITLPMEYVNSAQPARNALLQSVELTMTIGNIQHNYEWQYFVNQHPEGTCWICIEQSAVAQTIASGSSLYREIMFTDFDGPTWSQVARELISSPDESINFVINSEIDGNVMTTECVVDLVQWRPIIGQYLDRRITFACEKQA